MNIENFLQSVKDQSDTNRAIDLIFDTIDGLQEKADFDTCEQILKAVIEQIDDFPHTLWVSFLTITLVWRKQLKYRPELYKIAYEKFAQAYDEKEAGWILSGLE